MTNSVQKPDNNMVWAILSTLFCCLPFGIVAIINAAKVDGLCLKGDYEEAQKAADKAKKYAKIGAIIGIIGVAAYVIAIIISLASK